MSDDFPTKTLEDGVASDCRFSRMRYVGFHITCEDAKSVKLVSSRRFIDLEMCANMRSKVD